MSAVLWNYKTHTVREMPAESLSEVL